MLVSCQKSIIVCCVFLLFCVLTMPDVDAGAADVEMGGGGDPENPSIPPMPEEKGPLKPIAETTPMERTAGVVAGGAVGTSVAAIVIERSAIALVAGILSSAMGPYAYYQQTRLTDIKALQDTHAAVQAEVDRLAGENERLAGSVEELTSTADNLEDLEDALDTITQTQGQSVNEFELQVEENKKILAQMQRNLKTNVLQNLLSVILRSDTDGDYIVDDEEIDKMVDQMKRIAGVKVHADRFRAVAAGKDVDAVMEVIKNLLRDDVPESEQIFEMEEYRPE